LHPQRLASFGLAFGTTKVQLLIQWEGKNAARSSSLQALLGNDGSYLSFAIAQSLDIRWRSATISSERSSARSVPPRWKGYSFNKNEFVVCMMSISVLAQ
jgi:hypothetical protein